LSRGYEERPMVSYDDFTGKVQNRIKADSRAEAVRTTRAVLETIGERIGEGTATDIASPLPMEIDRYLLGVENGQSFEYQEFVDRVLERLAYEDLELETKFGRPAPVDRNDAVFRIRVVVDLLNEVVAGSDIQHLRNQLHGDYDELFELVDADEKPWGT